MNPIERTLESLRRIDLKAAQAVVGDMEAGRVGDSDGLYVQRPTNEQIARFRDLADRLESELAQDAHRT